MSRKAMQRSASVFRTRAVKALSHPSNWRILAVSTIAAPSVDSPPAPAPPPVVMLPTHWVAVAPATWGGSQCGRRGLAITTVLTLPFLIRAIPCPSQ